MTTGVQKIDILLCFAAVIVNMYLLYAYSFQKYSNWESERSTNEVNVCVNEVNNLSKCFRLDKNSSPKLLVISNRQDLIKRTTQNWM